MMFTIERITGTFLKEKRRLKNEKVSRINFKTSNFYNFFSDNFTDNKLYF
jgi:hypothetical protein